MRCWGRVVGSSMRSSRSGASPIPSTRAWDSPNSRRAPVTTARSRWPGTRICCGPVADGQPNGFCKLIVETGRRQIVGAHVLGEYSGEVIQMVAACMAAGMRVEEVAELQLAFPTFTEGVGMAAQMVVRALGIRA